MDKAKKITKVHMKKEYTEEQELIRPAVTKFATRFFTVQGLLDHKIGLKRMFQSNKWLCSWFPKSDDCKEVEKIVLNITFWKQYLRKSLEPLIQFLQKKDSDESQSIPSLYSDMYRAKLAIKSVHGDDAWKYGPFWSMIDNHWNSLFYDPLYIAATFLIHYNLIVLIS